VLSSPHDWCIAQKGDANTLRHPAPGGYLDEVRRHKSQRNRHVTCRVLQSSRAAMSSIVAVPASISESQSRPRAIAVTSLDRVSTRIGRVSPPDPSEARQSP
jgi:hypothetical protein